MRHSYVISAFISALFLSGCESLTKAPAQAQLIQSNGDNGQLVEVWVPGSGGNAQGRQTRQLDPLLNPKTPAPEFRETSAVVINCSQFTLDSSAETYPARAALLDRRAYSRAMFDGENLAEKRQVWRFNKKRLEAQLLAVAPGRISRLPTRVQPRAQPRPNIISDLLKNISKPPADDNPFLQEQQQLQHNQQVLEAQDVQLRQQEAEYAEIVSILYRDALLRFAQIPAERQSLTQLNIFELVRTQQIELCIQARVTPGSTPPQLRKELNSYYDTLAQAVVSHSRPQILQSLNSATSSAALQREWANQFPTPFLQELANKDVEIANGAAARLRTLQAHEATVREAAVRREAEERANQAAAVKKNYLDKAARNVPPTAHEALGLATTYLIESTEGYTGPGRLGKVERTGNNSFDDYQNNLIVGPIKKGETDVLIGGFRCQPKAQRQICHLEIQINSYKTDLLLGRSLAFKESETYELEFYWAAEGLVSPALKKKMSPLYWVSSGVSGGESSSAMKNINDSIREKDKANREFNDLVRSKAEERQEDARRARGF